VNSFLLIIRPFNCLFISLAVFMGAIINNYIYDYPIVFIAMISAMLIGAGGYVINDFYDIPIDAINKPNRILPSGKIPPKTAYLYGVFLFVLGFSISYFTKNLWGIIVAITNSVLLYLYAKKGKRVLIVNNLIVGYTTASAFLYGAIINQNVKNVVPLVLFTFLYTVTREIVKDAEDLEGDMNYGADTLATKFGRRTAVYASLFVALLLAALIYCCQVYGFLSLGLGRLLLISYTVPLIAVYLPLFREISKEKLYRASQIIKGHMFVLLFVMVLYR